jgi:hypothetical protein
MAMAMAMTGTAIIAAATMTMEGPLRRCMALGRMEASRAFVASYLLTVKPTYVIRPMLLL